MNAPRLAILQTRIHPPALSPLAALVDALTQNVAAIDLHVDNVADSMTGDEAVEMGAILFMMVNCVVSLRESVQAREARLMRER